jgi:hypothetical protein
MLRPRKRGLNQIQITNAFITTMLGKLPVMDRKR